MAELQKNTFRKYKYDYIIKIFRIFAYYYNHTYNFIRILI